MIILILLLSFLKGLSHYGVQDTTKQVQVLVLGIAQDAGYPQAGCSKKCCQLVYSGQKNKKLTTAIAIIDPNTNQRWLIDATPDIKDQLKMLGENYRQNSQPIVDGVFLTHAHIGHYIGLIHFGREAMGSKNITVYAMPRMYKFLSENGPWEQLISLNNITLKKLYNKKDVSLNEHISIRPFLVPHRDEYSETVGFLVKGPIRSLLYIPDIDKWENLSTPVENLIAQVDYALLDGTFFKNGEIAGRDMSEFSHPFIEESMLRFSALSKTEKDKIYFTHFNHSNPALYDSTAQNSIIKNGYHITEELSRFKL